LKKEQTLKLNGPELVKTNVKPNLVQTCLLTAALFAVPTVGTANGTSDTLHSFRAFANGQGPVAGMIQGSDGYPVKDRQ
jgi:hypothetical protein